MIFVLLSKNILFVGDSHTKGSFGSSLTTALKNKGNTVTRLATEGSGIAYWTGNSNTAKNFQNNIKDKDEIIIALGTNDFADTPKNIEKKITNMLNLIPDGKQCTWIGPPKYRRGSSQGILYSEVINVIKALSDTLKKNNKCTFIDSSDCPMTRTNKNDVHFNPTQSKVWSNCIAEKMKLVPTTIKTPIEQIAETKTEEVKPTFFKPIASKSTAVPSSEPKKKIPNVIAQFPTANDNCKITIRENKCAFFRGSFSQTKIAYLNNIRGALLQGKKIPAVCINFLKDQVPFEGDNCANINVAIEARSLEIIESARQAGSFLDLVPNDKDRNFITSFYQQLSFYGISEGEKNPEKIFSTIKNSPLLILEVNKRCPDLKIKIKIAKNSPYDFKNFDKKILYFKKNNGEYSSATIMQEEKQEGSKNILYLQDFEYYFNNL